MIKYDEEGKRQGVRGNSTSRPLLLEVALNGTRTRTDHPAIPISPEQQAVEARAAVAEGAGAIHVHVRDAGGSESLAPDDVAGTLEAIRTACPGIPIGIGTGAWIIPDLTRRLAAISAWHVLPDFASVNLHEAGAPTVMRSLLDKGIGVEAGIWNAPAARALVDSGLTEHCERILIEPAEGSCGWFGARVNLPQIERVLEGVNRPRLLHGLGPSSWYFVELSAKRSYDTRTGFEDTLTLPDGTRAKSNADLIATARRIVRQVIDALY